MDFAKIDPKVREVEASLMTKRYHAYHVPEYGKLHKERPKDVFRVCGVQLNSTSTEEIKERKIAQMEDLLSEWDIQCLLALEVGQNWSVVPPSERMASWFRLRTKVKAFTQHNTHDKVNVGRYQPGGCAVLTFGELHQYARGNCGDFRNLGRVASTVFYANRKHRTRVVTAYNLGDSKPKGLKTNYQQQLRYIQDKDLDVNPETMFLLDLYALLKTWKD